MFALALSDAVQTALIATIVPTIVAILNFLATRRVHEIVNSKATAKDAELAAAHKVIETLNAVIAAKAPVIVTGPIPDLKETP